MDTHNNAVLIEQPVAIPTQQQNQINQKKRSKQMSTDTIVAQPAEKINAADELANLLVEADNKRRSQLPHYPGLERFEMIRKLGDGAFSNVFEARDLKTGKKVAIKVAQKSHPNDKRANIMKEVEIMRNVRHPNIVQLIHYMETYDNYFLTLDLCQGGELFHQIVKLTYFSENLSRHVITQVALAVRHLHEECGVVHRDIKPENILFDPIPIIPSKKRIYRPTDSADKEDEGEFMPGIGGGGIGNIKLADFGLSKVIWDNSTLTPCGTVGYTAPEIVTDQRYSKSVDMWAIGCVLYTILCGFPPFYDNSIRALTEKVARGEYTFLSPWWDTISDSVKDLISHLLCVDARKRYTIDQFLNHPWIKEEPFIRNDPMPVLPAKKNQPLQAIAATNRYEQHKQEQKEQQEIEAMIQQAAKSNILTPPDIEQDEDLVMDDDNSLIHTTPDAATLRGIFDITYAVQRMEEEQSLNDTRKQHQQHAKPEQHPQPQPQLQNNMVQVPLAQQSHNLPMAQQLAKHSRGVANPINYRNHKPKNQQPAPVNMFGGPTGFHLDMNKATLIKNRQAMNMRAHDTRLPDDRDDTPATNGKRRVSTAHIESNGILHSTQAKFAYDELVSACADFLGSTSAVENEVIHFAESVLAVIGSPTTLDTAEVKRRLEQVLPVSHAFRHHRGMTISDTDCTILCSLADRVINMPLGQENNVDIVDSDDTQEEQQTHDRSDVYYIRHDEAAAKFQERLPKQLPSFVEANAEIGERDAVEYDMDVTPYDSEVDDDPPLQMRA
ncbi:pkinase-domain-containing protein [Mucor ambiguus]|uniref:Pkinase-domain-containing protein n=1 Tax=Mucor ambiguus TaxID=91626 RepID=A0A0C9MNC0_9FUNG|nr:pkinase-domain-containing protein [Mucor ambiguus]